MIDSVLWVALVAGALIALGAVRSVVERRRPRCLLCGRRVWRAGEDCQSCAAALRRGP